MALLTLALLWATSPSPGAQLLLQMDDALTRAEDQLLEYEATVHEADRAERAMSFRVSVKGKTWRRVDFLAPGDLKGMKVLVLSPDSMYVFMPAFGKVRRVASHAKEQGFMGSSYGQDEMALVTYSETFEAELVGENNEVWTLDLTLRQGAAFPYPRLQIDVRKELMQPREIRYYNAAGQKIKTETREAYTCDEQICNPKVMRMVDHTRGDLTTVLHRKRWKHDAGIPDSFFTTRALQR